jgi:hypothetical protein
MWSDTLVLAGLVITGITNFAFIPLIIDLWRRERLVCLLATFTMITSFMYHVCDVLGHGFYLNTGSWHRLDNVGTITGFCTFLVYLADLRDRQLIMTLQLSILFVVLVLQEKAPWDVNYTVYPIVACITIPLFSWLRRGTLPSLHRRHARTGLGAFAVAVVCFYKGLDEKRDFLRMWHGAWHMMVGVAMYHGWRIVLPPRQRAGDVEVDELNIVDDGSALNTGAAAYMRGGRGKDLGV